MIGHQEKIEYIVGRAGAQIQDDVIGGELSQALNDLVFLGILGIGK